MDTVDFNGNRSSQTVKKESAMKINILKIGVLIALQCSVIHSAWGATVSPETKAVHRFINEAREKAGENLNQHEKDITKDKILKNIGKEFTVGRLHPLTEKDLHLDQAISIVEKWNRAKESSKENPFKVKDVEVKTLSDRLKKLKGTSTDVEPVNRDDHKSTQTIGTSKGDENSLETTSQDNKKEKSDNKKEKQDNKEEKNYIVRSHWPTQQQEAINKEGLIYNLEKNQVVAIHIEDSTYKIKEEIGLGTTRAELLFEVGIPIGIWRVNSNSDMIFVYEAEKSEKNISADKQENFKPLANTYNSDSKEILDHGTYMVAFTISNDKVKAIDIIDSQVWPRFGLPVEQMGYLRANQMSEEDFALGGYRLNDYFQNDPMQDWREQGLLYGDDFIGYRNVAIATDKNKKITRIAVNPRLGTTRRGVTVGDTKHLVLYLYGVPNFEEENSNHDIVLGYIHPVLKNTYLLFTISKDGFVQSILLSDRTMTALNKK